MVVQTSAFTTLFYYSDTVPILLHTGERFYDALLTEMGPHIAYLFYYSDAVPVLLPTGERFYDAVLTEKGLEECHRLKASKAVNYRTYFTTPTPYLFYYILASA